MIFNNSNNRIIYNYLESNNLLYLKSPLKQALTVLSSSEITFIRKQTNKLTRSEFKEYVLKLLDRLFIEYKLPTRKKELATVVKNRQKKFRDNISNKKQRIQIYINKDKFQELERIRIKKNQTKQEFYSNLIEYK